MPKPLRDLLASRATVSPEIAGELARTLWGVTGVVKSLPGERDANFAIGDASILKISESGASPDRLAFEVVTIPPLRARPADIMTLANAFALEITRALGKDVFPGFSPRAEESLLGHSWPGNVRELKNVVERAVYRSASSDAPVDTVVIDPFENRWRPSRDPTGTDNERPDPAPPSHAHEPAPPALPREFPIDFQAEVAQFERRLLKRALDASRHSQIGTARALGLGYHQFRRLLKKHALV